MKEMMNGEAESDTIEDTIRYARQLATRAAAALGRSEFSVWIQFVFDLSRAIECGRSPDISAEAGVHILHGVSANTGTRKTSHAGVQEKLASRSRTVPRVPTRLRRPNQVGGGFWKETITPFLKERGGVVVGNNRAIALELEKRTRKTYKQCYDAMVAISGGRFKDVFERTGDRLELIGNAPEKKQPAAA